MRIDLVNYRNYNKDMIDFDPAKDAANIQKHGVSLSEAERLELDCALTHKDDRQDYGEDRFIALAPIGERLYCCIYTERNGTKRIISLRKANNREKAIYANLSDN